LWCLRRGRDRRRRLTLPPRLISTDYYAPANLGEQPAIAGFSVRSRP
jgi:hypothetical protein